MRVLLQRVSHAKVTVEEKDVGAIGSGLLLLAGAGPEDTPATVTAMASKIAGLRIFPDEGGKMNLSLLDCGGAALVVSQFTLYADCRKGRRPSFTGAAPPEEANRLIEVFVQALREAGVDQVAKGVFGADMKVSLCNDGPVTIWLDSSALGV